VWSFRNQTRKELREFTRTKVTKPLLVNRKLTFDSKSVASSNSVCDIQAFTTDEEYRARIFIR